MNYEQLNHDSNPGWKDKLTTRSPLCCGCWCLVITIVLLAIFLPLTFAVWIPAAIQENVDNAAFTFLSVGLSNATSESVLMNATIQVSNTGSYDAKMESFTGSVYLTDGSYIGTLELPSFKIKANEGATVSALSPLVVEELTNFQIFAHAILTGTSTDLVLKGDASIEVTLSTGTVVTSDVKVDNSITMDGVILQNAVTSNLVISSADSGDIISGTLDMSYTARTQSSLSLDFTNIRNNIYDSSMNQIGYATIELFSVAPGYNSLTGIPVIIERTAANSDSISTFFGNYLMGIDQTIIVVGPIPVGNTTTVVDYGVQLSVTAQGSPLGDQIVAGLMTAGSQQGWTVTVDGNDTDVKGAYTSIKNVLDVDIQIVETSAYLYLAEALHYKYDISTTVSTYPVELSGECNSTSSYAHIYTGVGMYEAEPTKTTVNVTANDASSFFVIAEPITGQYDYNTESEVKCAVTSSGVTLKTFHFPCCFLFETTAAICRDNPGLLTDSSSELEKAYIELSVDSNMTVLIDSQFEVAISYQQAFFPLSFGEEIYQGYAASLNFSCEDVTIIDSN